MVGGAPGSVARNLGSPFLPGSIASHTASPHPAPPPPFPAHPPRMSAPLSASRARRSTPCAPPLGATPSALAVEPVPLRPPPHRPAPPAPSRPGAHCPLRVLPVHPPVARAAGTSNGARSSNMLSEQVVIAVPPVVRCGAPRRWCPKGACPRDQSSVDSAIPRALEILSSMLPQLLTPRTPTGSVGSERGFENSSKYAP